MKTKLLVSVSLAIVITLSAAVAVITVYEKKRFRKLELDRIFYKTEFLVRRLGHLMYNSNWRYLDISLNNSMVMDPAMLYFVLKDREGDIVSASADGAVEDNEFNVLLGNPSAPAVYTRDIDLKGTGGKDGNRNFQVFIKKLSRDIVFRDTVRAEKDDSVFHSSWAIFYLGERLGTLEMGFSRKNLVRHLLTFQVSIIGVSLCILAAAMLMISFVVNRKMKPFERLVSQLDSLRHAKNEKEFRRQSGLLDLRSADSDIVEIENLIRAFDNITTLFIKNWDQLEDYRQNLEKMVAERTFKLNETNRELEKRIEERKAIEERLVNAQKLEAIGTLAGGIAHEFNNLFMGIQGNASLIKKKADDRQKVLEKTDRIMEIVDNGAAIVKQLLGFSRKGKYAPGALNLNKAIESNIKMFLHAKKNLTVELALAEDLWDVNADASQIDQCLLNLFLNASESVGSEGTLYVQTENTVLEERDVTAYGLNPGCYAKIMVKDTGTGMNENELVRIFDPFYTTKKIGHGTGLGLASVYGIIRNHGGFITAQSEPGKGTSFFICLPAIS